MSKADAGPSAGRGQARTFAPKPIRTTVGQRGDRVGGVRKALPSVLERMLSLWNGEGVDPASVYVPDCLQDGHSRFGPTDAAAEVAALRTGIPDLRFEVDDWFAVENRYVLRMRASGTHLGELATPIGHANATGATVAMRGIEVFELEDDRIVGVWVGWNWGDLLAALDAQLPT